MSLIITQKHKKKDNIVDYFKMTGARPYNGVLTISSIVFPLIK